ILRLRHRDPQGHSILVEADDDHLQAQAGNLLGFDAQHSANTMSRVDDIIPRLESDILGHSRLSLTYQPCRAPGSDAAIPDEGRQLSKASRGAPDTCAAKPNRPADETERYETAQYRVGQPGRLPGGLVVRNI